MRRISKRLLVCLLIVCCIYSNAAECFASVPSNTISPLYELTYKTKVSLSISSSGNALCSSYIKASDTTSSVSITVKLCKKQGGSWVPVTSWTVENQIYAAYVDQSYSVSAGTYQLQMTGTVVAANGSVETLSGVSPERIFN